MSTGDRFFKTNNISQPYDPGGYIPPDSVLARTAADLLERHTGEPGQLCAFCAEPSPCPSARHASEVRRAVGVNRGSFGDGVDQEASAANQQARRFGMEQRGGTPDDHLSTVSPGEVGRPDADPADDILGVAPSAALPDSPLGH